MLNNNVIDINEVETKNNVAGETKMQEKNLKTITVAVQVHKELKKAEVEGIFTLPGVTFEVKRRTIYATKEISSYSKKWDFADQCAEWEFEYEIEDYVIDTMEALWLEKCHAAVAEHERKYLLEEAARIAKLKEENNEDFVGETEMQEEVNDIDDIVEETGETTMQENNANNECQEDNYDFHNNIFTYEEETNQDVYVKNDYFTFNTGYHYEQITEIYGDDFFNSVLKETLEEYSIYSYKYDEAICFKNILEDEDQDFEETPGFMVLVETAQKIAKIIEGFPAEELFQIKKDNEDIFKNLINYHYDSQ